MILTPSSELVMGLTGSGCCGGEGAAPTYPPPATWLPPLPESHPLAQTAGDLGRVRQALEQESRQV